jgi:hypothetical protein
VRLCPLRARGGVRGFGDLKPSPHEKPLQPIRARGRIADEEDALLGMGMFRQRPGRAMEGVKL